MKEIQEAISSIPSGIRGLIFGILGIIVGFICWWLSAIPFSIDRIGYGWLWFTYLLRGGFSILLAYLVSWILDKVSDSDPFITIAVVIICFRLFMNIYGTYHPDGRDEYKERKERSQVEAQLKVKDSSKLIIESAYTTTEVDDFGVMKLARFRDVKTSDGDRVVIFVTNSDNKPISFELLNLQKTYFGEVEVKVRDSKKSKNLWIRIRVDKDEEPRARLEIIRKVS